VEFVTFKVRASLPERPFHLPPLTGSKSALRNCVKGQRPAFSLLRRKTIPFTVYDRLTLFPGARIPGPAILEERESTIVVGEDARARVDEFGFVWIDVK
jgi:N-methylhydantoinase A